MENKLRVTGGVVGGGWAKWVRGTKESTPEIIVALYAILDVNFNFFFRRLFIFGTERDRA